MQFLLMMMAAAVWPDDKFGEWGPTFELCEAHGEVVYLMHCCCKNIQQQMEALIEHRAYLPCRQGLKVDCSRVLVRQQLRPLLWSNLPCQEH